MKNIVILLFIISSEFVFAGKCSTNTSITNNSGKDLEIEMCIHFEAKSSAGCEFPKHLEIQHKEIVSESFTYMCGYSSDLSISEYWFIYREKGSEKYVSKKYSESGIVL